MLVLIQSVFNRLSLYLNLYPDPRLFRFLLCFLRSHRQFSLTTIQVRILEFYMMPTITQPVPAISISSDSSCAGEDSEDNLGGLQYPPEVVRHPPEPGVLDLLSPVRLVVFANVSLNFVLQCDSHAETCIRLKILRHS
jgi:hypothetical protein